MIRKLLSKNARLWTIGFVVGIAATGCVSLPQKSSSTQVSSIRRESGTGAHKMTPAVLEAEVMRFSDELTAVMAQASDDFAAQVGTPQARVLALNWKTGTASMSMMIASSPNPTANLLDMVVLVTLGRMNLEEYWQPRYGAPLKPMLDASRGLEDDAWSLAGEVLTPKQLDELRTLIRDWRAKHPGLLDTSVRFRDFAELAAAGWGGPKSAPGSVLGLLFLDPFSGLDPAMREMQQTRYVADRALFVLKRMPTLMRWQSELLFSEALATPDVQQLLTNSTRFAQSAEQFANAAQTLPERLSAETQKLMNETVAQSPQWQALLLQLQQTLRAGNEMATSVNSATKSLDAFVGHFDNTTSAQSATSAGAKSFDIAEYGEAADRIAGAAQELNTLVASLDKTTPQVEAAVERTGSRGKELVDYTFHRAIGFLALALSGFVLAMLVYRFLASRLFGKGPRQP